MTPQQNEQLKDYPHWVCTGCGMLANGLTCLQKYGSLPLKYGFDVSTYHTGHPCDVCGKTDVHVTEARDFFYPDFSLIEIVKQQLKSRWGKGGEMNESEHLATINGYAIYNDHVVNLNQPLKASKQALEGIKKLLKENNE